MLDAKWFFIGRNEKVKKQPQLDFINYQKHVTTETDLFLSTLNLMNKSI